MKRILKDSLIGMLCGIAGNYMIALIASYVLKLGYFMPYPAAMPESVGGELNAVLFTMLSCAALGIGIGLAYGFASTRTMKPLKRILCAVLSIAIAVIPALLVANRIP